MAANLRFLMSSAIVCMIKSSLSIVTARDLNAEDYDDLSQGITNATFLDEEEDETRLWKAHGSLMAAAWGVMVPLAVGASLLRSWLPEGLWFRLHLALNAIAMFCVFAGFGIAVHVFSDHNEKHFVEFQHRKMGLVVFLLAVLQLVGGIVRPGLPQPNTSDATTSVPDNIDTVGKEETPPMPPTKKSLFRSIWEYTHRALGIGSLALAWWTCDSGLQLYNQEFGGEECTAAFWGVTGGLASVIAILTVFAKFGGSK